MVITIAFSLGMRQQQTCCCALRAQSISI